MLPPVTQPHHSVLRQPFHQSSSLPRSISVGKQMAEKGRKRSVLTHNARPELRLEAGAQRTLLAVSSRPLFGPAAAQLANRENGKDACVSLPLSSFRPP
jgi:hypothetical protein